MKESTVTSKIIAYGLLQALAILAGTLALLWFLWEIQAVLAYIFTAAVLSLMGRPIVLLLRDRLKLNNTLSVVITLVIMLLIILGGMTMFVPIITEQIDHIDKINVEELTANLENLNTQFSDYFNIERIDLLERVQNLEYVKNFDFEIIPQLVNGFLGTLGSLMIGLFSVLFITFFLLKDSRLLLEGVLVFSKKGSEGKFLRAFTKIKQLLSRYFIGLLLQVLILFVLYTIILLITGTTNAILIAILCALLNLVPYLGPAIGYLLMTVFVMSGHLESDFSMVIFPKLIIVFVGYGIVQTIDNFVNQPLIFGKSVKSHPLEIFIVILIAGLVFGVLGLILAVPTYTAIKVIAKEFLSEYKIVKKLTHNL